MTENEAKACAMLARVCGTLGEIMKAVEPLEKQLKGGFMASFVGASLDEPATARDVIHGCLGEVKQAIEQLGKPAESEIDWAKIATKLRGQPS